jgi:UDP-glucose 4-epimerase
MQCLVTGGAGFIGSHVAECLIAQGNRVRVVDSLATGKHENVPPQAEFIEADIRNAEAMDRACVGVDYVFHLAALPRIQPSFNDPQMHDEVNVLGSLRVFEAARKAKVKKLVYSSSSACYGTPEIVPTPETAPVSCLSPYALQKYAGEQYLLMLGERFGVPVVALRYFNVYGPRSFSEQDRFSAYSSVIGIFARQRELGQVLTITGSGDQRRDFVHVYDVARANWLAASRPVSGEIVNIGCGASYTISEIADRIGGEKTYIPERKGEAMITQADISKAKRLLDWIPQYPLEKGILHLSVPARAAL